MEINIMKIKHPAAIKRGSRKLMFMVDELPVEFVEF